MSKLALIPVDLAEANAFVAQHHRHHAAVVGHKFSLGAVDGDRVIGIAIVGRPVSRVRDDGSTLDVTRLCTDGTRNACSFLYGAAARAAFALGYCRIGTYILASEPGVSLRASGGRMIGEVRGRSWSCKSRPRVDKHPTEPKLLFEFANPARRANVGSGNGSALNMSAVKLRQEPDASVTPCSLVHVANMDQETVLETLKS